MFSLDGMNVRDMMSSAVGVARAVAFVKGIWSVAPEGAQLIGPFGGWQMRAGGMPSTDNKAWLQTPVRGGTLIGTHWNHFHFGVPPGWTWPR